MIQVSAINKGRELSFKQATAELSKELKQVKSKIPTITAQSLDHVARWARKEVIEETAKSLQVPPARISRVIVRGEEGKKKSVPRFKLIRATRTFPVTTLVANNKGIDVSDVPHTWNKQPGGGVTARGTGKFFRGAFKAKLQGKPRVLRRKGKERLPLKSMYVATKQSMLKAFETQVNSSSGAAIYAAKFRELGDRALAKAGFK